MKGTKKLYAIYQFHMYYRMNYLLLSKELLLIKKKKLQFKFLTYKKSAFA